jgi:glycosyltransferase involved in cell wall biosynthesis
MGMGVPILMSLPEGEATGIVAAAGCGVCVPPEDPEAMAAAIAALADDPGRTGLYRTAARTAAHRYSRDAQASRMLDVFSTAMESP